MSSFDYQIEGMEKEIEQLRLQLAGCSVAALGATDERSVAHKGDYGWSQAYQDVLDLRKDYEQLKAAIKHLKLRDMIL